MISKDPRVLEGHMTVCGQRLSYSGPVLPIEKSVLRSLDNGGFPDFEVKKALG
jgi:hypothetical protein